jgi:hypothetical protein
MAAGSWHKETPQVISKTPKMAGYKVFLSTVPPVVFAPPIIGAALTMWL